MGGTEAGKETMRPWLASAIPLGPTRKHSLCNMTASEIGRRNWTVIELQEITSCQPQFTISPGQFRLLGRQTKRASGFETAAYFLEREYRPMLRLPIYVLILLGVFYGNTLLCSQLWMNKRSKFHPKVHQSPILYPLLLKPAAYFLESTI
ncbi:hypothetical protein BaRGS_00029682 [Batillaria attramentaria]|uniref:Uncharacterized protein n=1 Tax=Batillaria attramentaria TaxID=370345 RepID=A0ABD0JVI7_9CAEN